MDETLAAKEAQDLYDVSVLVKICSKSYNFKSLYGRGGGKARLSFLIYFISIGI